MSTIANAATLTSTLNVVGASTHVGAITCSSTVNISGVALLNNSTTINSSLFVSGTTILQGNTTAAGNLNIVGVLSTSLVSTTIANISTMNVSGYTTLANNTTVLSSLNVSGVTTLNGNVTCISNLNVLGNVNAPNLDSKAGFSFTCASTLVLNSTTYYKWDIDLTKYTTSIQLPQGAGYNLRKFRIYTWLASSDFRQSTGRLDENSYSIWMSNLSGVYSIRAYGIGAGFITDNYYLTKNPAVTSPQFLLSNSYNNLTYASSVLGTYIMCLIIDELA